MDNGLFYDAQIRWLNPPGDEGGEIRGRMTHEECSAWLTDALRQMEQGHVLEMTVRFGFGWETPDAPSA